MVATAAGAANAYAQIGKLAQSISQNAKPTPEMVNPDFKNMVMNAVSDVVQTGAEADNKTMSMARGKADVVDVVTAISETEVAFETMITIRDKVIAAYEEIMRMPI
jgi:flagellar hook-basal body complex protein FliE